jgi:thymidine kinase
MGTDAAGRIEVITGPMFAGKTEELLRRVRRAEIAGQRVHTVTHAIDTRSGPNRIASHIGRDAPSAALPTADVLVASVPDGTQIVAIDEAHFFGPALVDAVTELADRGVLVLVAGLDVTFEGAPFEPLPTLMVLAERVDKLTAVCTVCGAEAVFHVRIEPPTAQGTALDPGHVGGAEKYQARCRRHFSPTAT